MRKFIIFTTFFACVFTACGFSCADEIENEIQAGLKAYKTGKYTKAITSLEYAAQQVRQLKADKIETYFPNPLRGWKANEAKSAAIGSIFMGGGITGSRKYSKGKAGIEISIATDSPMITFVTGILANPAMLSITGNMGGGTKLTRIKGNQAIREWNPDTRNGDIKIVVANRVLITISGSQCKESDLSAYANAIDYKKIESSIAD